MPRVTTPPSYAEMIGENKEFFEELALKLIDHMESIQSLKRYYHWDEIRHRKPPDGLTVKQWWVLISISRQQRHVEGLVDRGGVGFFFGQPDPISEQLHRIDCELAGRLGDAAEPVANEGTRDRYLIHSLREEAIRSSQIEGAATTRQVAKEMLREKRPPRDISEQMILNNFQAMEKIRTIRDQPMTVELLLEVHTILTDRTLDDPGQVGRFRTEEDFPVLVVDDYGEVYHTPPPAVEVPERIARLLKFANDMENKPFIHPVLRAIILHFWLAYDHPFCDGNGRCARALFYWSMLRQGYWLTEFISISEPILKAPGQYEKAYLYTETDRNDLTYFILFHLKMILRGLDGLQTHIEKKRCEQQELRKELRLTGQFNVRQLALIAHALRHPHARYTIASHRDSHGVTYQTSRTDLFDLVENSLLIATRTGRTYFFIVPEDFRKRLTQASSAIH
jgi:Fic family protein